MNWFDLRLWGALAAILALLAAYTVGYRAAHTAAADDLSQVHAAYAKQARQVAAQQQQQLARQISRTNAAEIQLLDTQQQLDTVNQRLRERIAHVTVQYKPAPEQQPQPIPHCVFTVGWLRQYNAAIAGLPASGAGAAATGIAQTPDGTADADTELLESGVTPSDILAHAIDYGRWARGNAAQLNALLDLTEP